MLYIKRSGGVTLRTISHTFIKRCRQFLLQHHDFQDNFVQPIKNSCDICISGINRFFRFDVLSLLY